MFHSYESYECESHLNHMFHSYESYVIAQQSHICCDSYEWKDALHIHMNVNHIWDCANKLKAWLVMCPVKCARHDKCVAHLRLCTFESVHTCSRKYQVNALWIIWLARIIWLAESNVHIWANVLDIRQICPTRKCTDVHIWDKYAYLRMYSLVNEDVV